MAENNNAQSIIAVVIAIVVGALISLAGSDGGDRVGSLPLFALCGALAFAINWAAFVPAALKQTEHFYDLVGGITYISVVVVAVLLASDLDLRSTLVAAMVMVWALRLSLFLFRRIAKAGKDDRFDQIKTKPLRFLMAWTVQGLWVLLTAAAALAVITGGVSKPLGLVGVIGITVAARVVARTAGFPTVEQGLRAGNAAIGTVFAGAILAMAILVRHAVAATFGALDLLLHGPGDGASVAWVLLYAAGHLVLALGVLGCQQAQETAEQAGAVRKRARPGRHGYHDCSRDQPASDRQPELFACG